MTPPPHTDDDRSTGADEEYESIPWDALVRPAPLDWRRVANLAALGVAVAAIAMLTVRTLWPPEPVAPAGSVPIPSTTTSTIEAPDPVATPPPASTAAEDLPSEADLMAIDPTSLERSAAAVAEWFIATYFTVDGGDRRLDPWSEDVPEPEVIGVATSYVESATAVDVQRVDQNSLRVTVIVRTLSAPSAGSGFRRDPVRAMSVPIVFTEEGPSVADLPTPVPVPHLLSDGRHANRVEVDPASLERAREAATLWGDPAEEPYSVTADDSGAVRVALMVTDTAGIIWPVAIWFDANGRMR
jgi:hypothetical protein